jgi:predicted RNA-binding protein YlqC (UPF0109 family)
MNLKNLLQYFLLNLIDKPESVSISEVAAQDKQIIQIKVAPQDLAKVIGEQGQTFRALRSLVYIIEPGSKKDLVVDIIE